MMENLRQWLLGIVLVSFAVGTVIQLVPKGKEQGAVRLVGGLLMALALLRPLGSISWELPSVAAGIFGDSLRTQTEEHREMQQKELCAIIAERLETYIWDKATELGLDCAVTVGVRVTESGIPLPDTVMFDIPRHPALAVWLEEVVGLPAEKQIWQEGSAWTTEKG